MPLYLDGNKVGNYLYFGNTRIEQAYLNGTLVYQMRVPFSDVEYTVPGIHVFNIPEGNKYIDVQVYGAQGQTLSNTGGLGGFVKCRVKVIGMTVLYCYVGGQQSGNNVAQYNASDIRTSWDSASGSSLNNRLLVAGGGGSGGRMPTITEYSYAGSNGGAGGYPNGADSEFAKAKHPVWAGGAGGATQSAGGNRATSGGDRGAVYGNNGGFGLGGNGGAGWGGWGGPGGAGWYGGGGGACAIDHHEHDIDSATSGGGGGSSYANPSYCTSISYSGGVRQGNGYIRISQVEL